MLILDTETTGLVDNLTTRFERQPEIVELTMIDIDPSSGSAIREFDQLIKPSQPITDEITAMNGIDNSMVENAPDFKSVASAVRDMIESSDSVVAHNAAFDRDMIDLEFAKLGMTKVAWPHVICTVEATVHMTGFRQSLSSLHELLFGTKFEGAHRARADVLALARCVVELKRRGEL